MVVCHLAGVCCKHVLCHGDVETNPDLSIDSELVYTFQICDVDVNIIHSRSVVCCTNINTILYLGILH
jgi:hypothetical protein